MARLDTRLLEAERSRLAASRAALEAQAERARRTAKRQAELRDRGFATDQAMDDISLDLARLEAEIDAVDAGIDAARIDLDKVILRAPFPGTVALRHFVWIRGRDAFPGWMVREARSWWRRWGFLVAG